MKQPTKPKPNREEDVKYVPKNVLFIGDSHAHNLDVRVLEHETNIKMDRATAYTVAEDDDARYPKVNFLKVVPERMANKQFDTLILQGAAMRFPISI